MDAPQTELTTTTDRSPESASAAPLTRWAWLIALSAAAYPLGIGPAYWLTVHEWIPDSASEFIHHTLFRPLWWLCTHSPTAAALAEWYVALWIG